MKLTLLKPHILARTNGGDISIIEYFRRFQAEGAELDLFVLLSKKDREQLQSRQEELRIEFQPQGYLIDDISLGVGLLEEGNAFLPKYQEVYEEAFLYHLREAKPDFAFAHYTDFFAVSSLMQWDPDRSFIFQTDNEFPRIEKLKNFPGLLKHYRQIKNFLVASDFMKEKVSEAFPDTEVSYLPNTIETLDKAPELKRLKARYWLFVNPVKEKGVDFVLDLARRCPEENFLFVGNWDRRSFDQPLPNIKFVERQAQVEKIFQEAYALLFPSHWEEAFGRLPLEAMHFGIPVLGSFRGALPQTIGDGGLLLDLKPELWIDAMNRIKMDQGSFQAQAKKRVEEYRRQRDDIFAKFWQVLEFASRKSQA